ncbi:hypothetical protein JTB14_025591 [Gonioctena quinquepunctata]|nr:hypothetical protein JTB14_025591 [Gonioctena quinquepunctata]
MPDTLLKQISFKCKTGCNTAACTCRKHGSECSELCSTYTYGAYSNITQAIEDVDCGYEFVNSECDDDIINEVMEISRLKTIDVSGYNSKNKKGIVYPNPTSVDRPIEHGPGLPVPVPPESSDEVFQSSPEFDEIQPSDDDVKCSQENLKSQLFTQAELNDLVIDLGLTKEKARLKEKHLLECGTSIYHYRTRDEQFAKFYSQEEDLV